MKKILLILLLLLNTNTFVANSKMKVDFVSKHLWRGTEVSKTPAINPEFTIFHKFNSNNINSTINFSAWACHSIDDSYNEVDLYVEYELNDFSFTLFDYFCPTPTEKNFFDYTSATHRHTFDLVFQYKGSETIPFNFLLSNMFYGDRNTDGEEQYSTYIKIGYVFTVNKFDGEIFVASSAYESYYAKQLAIVNTGIKLKTKLQFEQFQVPLFFMLVSNPDAKNIFVNVGLGLTISP